MAKYFYVWCILLLFPMPLMANKINPIKRLVVLASLVRRNSFFYLDEAIFPHIPGEPVNALPVTREVNTRTDTYSSSTPVTYSLTMTLKEITDQDATLRCTLEKKLTTSQDDTPKQDSFTGSIPFNSPLDYEIIIPRDSESLTLRLRAYITADEELADEEK